MPFSNGLSRAQAERLALLAEECGELVMAIGKVLRHGYDSYNPDDRSGPDNREAVEAECGDVLAAIELLTMARDIEAELVSDAKADKLERVWKYMHHSKPAPAATKYQD